jgi:two-component system OmpR family sensor kinase
VRSGLIAPPAGRPSARGGTASGGDVAFEVIDTGRGVPPHAVQRIFERFARADHARNRDAGGAGLGLAIVSAIAAGHGGSCTVAPQPRGTAFSLRLPEFRAERLSAVELVTR